MAKFGWAYIDCQDQNMGSGSEGPSYSLQFVTESGGGTTGSALLSYYTASQYSYDPSTMVLSGNFLATGSIDAPELSASVGVSVSGILQVNGVIANATTISADTTIPGNYNAVLYGPITVAVGTTLTVSTDANLKIKDFADV